MSEPAWIIANIDLAQRPQALAASGRPHLLYFWWRGLPLGMRALTPGELPFSVAQMLEAAAPMLADQALARSAEGPARWAGVDGVPEGGVTLAEAERTDGLARLDVLAEAPPPEAGRLSVVVCTRDRPQMLARCLASLAAQSSPPGQVVVVDNSAEGGARATCADWPNLTYVHEARAGLSRARNAGVAACRGELTAFTDDDAEPAPDWTQEIVRAFAQPTVQAVTGLVLPAALDTPAQRAFELDLSGFTQRFYPLVFDGRFLELTRDMGPQVWRIGAGANMAFRRSVFARVGGFDTRLGAGAAGCSEDSEFWYRILAAGGTCLYEPRAVVRHHHRSDWPGLRRQFRAYMRGHVAALVAQADRYGDRGNIRRIVRQLPVYFLRTAAQAIQNLQGWRLRLLLEEVIGWGLGLQHLVRPAWRRAGRSRRQPERLSGVIDLPEVRHA
jgi:GT2 family glycosyltransferase